MSIYGASTELNAAAREAEFIYSKKTLDEQLGDLEKVEAAIVEARKAIEAQKAVYAATKFVNVLIIKRQDGESWSTGAKTVDYFFTIEKIPEQFAGATDYEIAHWNLKKKGDAYKYASTNVRTETVVYKQFYHYEDVVQDGKTVRVEYTEAATWERMFEELNKVLDATGRAANCPISRIILEGPFRYEPEKIRKLSYDERRKREAAGLPFDKVRHEKDLKLVYEKVGVTYPYPEFKF